MWAAGGRRRRAHDDSCVPEPWPSRGATPRSLSVPRGCCGFPCAPAALPGLAGTVSSRTNKPRRQRRAEARLATAAQRSCAYGARAVGDAAPVGNEKGQISRYRSASHRSLSASPDRPADRLGATSCTVIPAVYASSTRRVHARVRGGAGGDLVLLGAPFPPCSISRLASHPSASRVGLRVRAWAYGPDSTRLHLAAARQAGSGASSRPRDWCRAHLSLIILTAMHAVVSLRIFACVLDCVASVAGAADGLRPGEMWCQPSAVRLQPAASLRVAFGQGLFSLLREGGGAERDDRKRADSDQRRGWGEARDR